MKYLAPWLLLLAVSCTPAPQHRVDLTISNRTSRPMKLRASTLGVSRSILLQPGESWTGWWDKRFMGSEAAFEIDE